MHLTHLETELVAKRRVLCATYKQCTCCHFSCINISGSSMHQRPALVATAPCALFYF